MGGNATSIPSQRNHMPNVVFVESDPQLRQYLAAQVPSAVRTATVIESDGPTSAMDVIRTTPVDVIVIDAAIDAGIDAATVLFAVAARHPRATVLMRTTDPDRAVECRGGIAWVYGTTADHGSLVEGIREAVAGRTKRGGTLSDMDLVDVVACLHRTGWSGALAIRDGRRSGMVVLRSGAIIHAVYDGTAGDAAAAAILTAAGGTICECDPPATTSNTVVSDTGDLLRNAVVAIHNRSPEDTVEITEDDLLEFMGVEEEEEGGAAGFQLFSDDELAELALDDAMAIPIPKKTI